jgi:translation initiation factor IF-1
VRYHSVDFRPIWHTLMRFIGSTWGGREAALFFYREGETRQGMARDDLVAMEGKVVEVLVGGNFRVNVEGGHSVLAHLAGRMRRNRIRVVLGDQVTVAVSPYDPSRGLITFRSK